MSGNIHTENQRGTTIEELQSTDAEMIEVEEAQSNKQQVLMLSRK